MYLVVGANGQLGHELKLLLGENAVYADREELDITDENAVKAFCNSHNFQAIVNCAAYTAVDKAEENADVVEKINVLGPRNLAQTGIPIIHISTDYVFEGTGHLPYVETDEACPCSVYGKTKLAGEKVVLEHASAAFVLRTSWLYSAYGNNFVKTMLRLGAEKEILNVVFDQIGTPTYAKDLAKVIVMLLPKLTLGKKEIYHYSDEGVCSWYDFAVEIMSAAGLQCKVLPIESKDYPTLAQRPAYSVLNKAKIKRDFGITINHWRESLLSCLKELS